MLRQASHTEAAELLASAPHGFYELPDDERDVVQEGFDAVDTQFKPLVARAVKLGLPTSGNDGYVEFALPPRSDVDAVARDVATLYHLGLLETDYTYPLHMTLGGIAISASAAYLLCSTEIIGNIPAERITQRNTWNVKGRGGVKYRSPSELQLGARTGVEFRTLQLQSEQQFRSMATTAYAGAQAITTKHPAWHDWRALIQTELATAGLPTHEYTGCEATIRPGRRMALSLPINHGVLRCNNASVSMCRSSALPLM